ncbi:topoisomerase DNA-binding C4 zinc finger domain-containing protein [Desulfoluna spongiiphila]|uniref:topoisomerase DNA-binding C4 zinc finger domain-containing protein n=1 Tax=Desulfoluna spongiiphila TaxID=419481 RepID=UPI001D02805D|nr:topoisomerase DNA-binding C4 zinc finger domain-containing protein [Desulfoluna spongiiphila]
MPEPDPTRWQPAQEVRTCPRCGGELILRTAKKGPNAGLQFYGCVSFPKCRHTEQIKAAS